MHWGSTDSFVSSYLKTAGCNQQSQSIGIGVWPRVSLAYGSLQVQIRLTLPYCVCCNCVFVSYKDVLCRLHRLFTLKTHCSLVSSDLTFWVTVLNNQHINILVLPFTAAAWHAHVWDDFADLVASGLWQCPGKTHCGVPACTWIQKQVGGVWAGGLTWGWRQSFSPARKPNTSPCGHKPVSFL